MSFDIIAIVSVKGNGYRIRFCGMSKCEAVNLMKKVNLNENSKYIIWVITKLKNDTYYDVSGLRCFYLLFYYILQNFCPIFFIKISG